MKKLTLVYAVLVSAWALALAGAGFAVVGSDTVTTFAGTGFGAYNGGSFPGDGIPATTAEISLPADIELDSAGNLYIAEQLGNRVRKVDAATGLVSTVAGTGAYSAGGAGDGGPATQAQIGGVTGLALDASDNLYVSENVENYITRIRKVDAATGVISTLVDMGPGHFVSDLEVGPDGYLYGSHHYPYDVATTSYVMKIDPLNGATTIVPGTTTFDLPTGLAFDGAGNLYVTESFGNRVRKIDAAIGAITTVAGTGGASSSGDGGPATAAEVYNPGSVAFDSVGNLYVGEYGGHKVRKVDPLGLITTVAGSGATGFSGDGGPAIDAAFNTPASLAFDAAGNLYISDTYNYRIRRVATSVDATPPVLSLPADITAEATSAAGAVVTYTATATDDVDGAVTPACSPASGSTFALGTTTVTCTATDSAGNSSTGSFTVTVQDTTAPAVTCVNGPNPSGKNEPNGSAGFHTITATDAVGVVTLQIVDSASSFVSSNLSSGSNVKLTRSPGSASEEDMAGVVSKHIRTTGAPAVRGVDAAGNVSQVDC